MNNNKKNSLENEIVNANINAEIEKLAEQFLEDLKIDLKELDDYFISITQNIHITEVCNLSKDLTHRLIGSAGLFGFTGIVDTLSKLNNLYQLLTSSNRNKNIIKVKIQAQLSKLKTIHQELLKAKTDNKPMLNLIPCQPNNLTNFVNHLRILIIEDDITSGELLFQILNPYCKYLNWSTNISSAMELLQSEIYDLVLLDLNLPDSHGLKTLETIQNIAHELPVIILTASNDIELSLKAISQGASEYLVKNMLKPDNLLNVILQVLEKQDRIDSKAKKALIDDFISILSHDLNTPIISALNCLEILKPNIKKKLTPEELIYCEKLQSSLMETQTSIKNLKEIYRLQQNADRLPKQQINLKSIFKTILAELNTEFKNKNLKVTLNIKDAKLNILANEELFRVIIMKLLYNTISYSMADSLITININLTKNNTINILISNEGKKINPSNAILNRPWSGVPGQTYVSRTGLGLYFANLIAKKHDGVIRCLGSKNNITSFKILWPNDLSN